MEKELKENAMLGAEIIKQYLMGKMPGSDKIRVAQQAVTQYHKHKATSGATDALKYQMFRDVAKDREELKGYVKASFPEMKEVKLLE